jgi:hypothetical protein
VASELHTFVAEGVLWTQVFVPGATRVLDGGTLLSIALDAGTLDVQAELAPVRVSESAVGWLLQTCVEP